MANGSTNTGSILDVIHEKIANIEQVSNKYSVTLALNDTLKLQAKKERLLRASTITFNMTDKIDHNKIMAQLEEKWCIQHKEAAMSFWANKLFSFCQFTNPETKDAFLDFLVTDNALLPIKELLIKPDHNGLHFFRMPVKLEINNIRGNIKTDIVQETLSTIVGDSNLIIDLKESKPNPLNKSRNIYFKTPAKGFNRLFRNMDGSIQYTNAATSTRTKLYIKVNVRPWQCRECLEFSSGLHQCPGKLCVQCGTKGHTTKECTSKTKYCSNCRQKGHKAKDTHCQSYLNMVAKEVRKYDFPIDFLEDKDLRFILTKHIQLK